VRVIPGGTHRLPSPALGTGGGGLLPIDPQDSDGRRTIARIFELEVTMPHAFKSKFLGKRVLVRLDHGYYPLGMQLYRTIRQLFLRLFDV